MDIYSTAGAAVGVIGFFLLLTRSRILQAVVLPLTATGTIALTAYTAHVILTGLWPRDWSAMVVAGDPVWQAIWIMLLVHWLMVAVIGLVVYFLRVRGPLESLLRSASRVGARN